MNKFYSEKKLPPKGHIFKTIGELTSDIDATFTADKHHLARRVNGYGTFVGAVPGCGGDAWFIKHNDGLIGAYYADELKDVP